MAKKENQLISYPNMWLVLKVKKEAKEKQVSVSEIIADALFHKYNKKA